MKWIKSSQAGYPSNRVTGFRVFRVFGGLKLPSFLPLKMRFHPWSRTQFMKTSMRPQFKLQITLQTEPFHPCKLSFTQITKPAKVTLAKCRLPAPPIITAGPWYLVCPANPRFFLPSQLPPLAPASLHSPRKLLDSRFSREKIIADKFAAHLSLTTCHLPPIFSPKCCR